MSALCGLPENCVRYMLFPNLGDGNSNTVSKESLETISADYTAMLSPYISSYIWQCDPFNLQVVQQTESGGYYLEGLTCFDDNIEDEWFIVYLLLQLTKEDQSLVVKVEDNDGEFLLIEAADHIPKWLNPETSENRVFLYCGSIHIIPIAKNPGQVTPIPNGVPSVRDAVVAVRQFSSVTEAHTSVQQAIHKRIEGYPKKIRELQHRAHCFVPAGVAAVLKEKPHLVSSAVRAFYLRTPSDLKMGVHKRGSVLCNLVLGEEHLILDGIQAFVWFYTFVKFHALMQHAGYTDNAHWTSFTLRFPLFIDFYHDIIPLKVLFTRCLYAQLINQNYTPDKRVGWNLPPVNHPDFKSHDLGMKLACGFEILASNAPKSSSTEEENVGNLDFSADVRWIRFLKSLTDKGYFKGEIEGSRLYNHLLVQAQNFYQDTLSRVNSSQKYYPGTLVRKILGTVNVNYEELKAAENNLAPPDDDSWLVLTPDELEAVLTGRSGNGVVKEREIAETVTGPLKSFLHHPSSMEGAEFPANVSKKQKVGLDPEAFSDAFRNILDFKVPDSDDERSSSSMSSYSYEDDSEVELGESGASGVKKMYPEGSDILSSMKMYMKQMDQELASTDVGKSFERLPPVSKAHQDAPEQGSHSLDESLDIDEESDEFRPVDIDMTALKNMLESYTSQQGLPGPASNLLSSMGVHLPQDSEL